MKRSILFTILVLLGISTKAYDFSAINSDGVTLYYLKNAPGSNYVSVVANNNYGKAYEGNINIPAIVKYNSEEYVVIRIDDAFNGCSKLTSVSIPNSVLWISDYAFSNCSGLISVTIGNSVTSIGINAFSGCSGLTSITIPNSVTSIKSYAFAFCSGLTSITIPNSVESIGGNAFYKCSGLTSINVSSQNPFFDSRDNCNAIIKTDTNKLIVGCSTTIIPNSVTSIESSAFSECSGLTSINIPNSVTSIGNYAFSGCSGLTSVTIPNSVTSIGDDAFKGCNSLPVENNLRYADTYLVGAVDKTLSTYNIKEGTKWIGNSAFEGCTGLTSVIIPNSVTSIEYQAFANCTSLTSVTIGNSVTTIGNCAFYSCSSLTSITIPNSVTSIGGIAFDGCSSLPVENNLRYADTYLVEAVDKTQSTYTIKEKTKWIGSDAFEGCTGLTSITIPNSVTSIGTCAFESCSGLTSITIPNSVKSIGNYVFRDCSSLKSITSPNSVESIGYGVFDDCINEVNINIIDFANSNVIGKVTYSSTTFHYFYNNIKLEGNVTLPNDIKIIGDYAFAQCKDIKSIAIPNSVTSIGSSAFRGCSGLTSINIPNSVTSVGDQAFYQCSGLTSITIPNSVTSIESYAFAYCSGLTSITIPNSVESIGGNAFYKCSGLTSINIPNSVTSIGSYAFYKCSGLKDITVNWTENIVIPESGFDYSILSNAILYVPQGTVSKYKSAEIWKEFETIKEQIFIASSISLSKNSLSMYVGESFPLTATILPENTTDKSVTWSSSDSTIVTVSADGLLTAVSDGLATITAKTNDGSNLSACCNVTTSTVYATSLSLSKTSLTLYVDDTDSLIATVLPNHASYKTVEWSYSDSCVSVDNGVVIALYEGTSTVKATTTDGTSLSASCVVTVKKYTQSVELVGQIPVLDFDGEMYKLEASASSGLPISYEIGDRNVVSLFDLGDAVYLNPVSCGNTTITIKQEGNYKYEPVELVANIEVAASGYQDSKTLIAYYSNSTAIDDIVVELAKQVGSYSGYVYTQRIEPTNSRVNEAGRNKAVCDSIYNRIKAVPDDINSYPSIMTIGVNPSEYDAILMVYPLWDSKTAAPMMTFQLMYDSYMKGKSLGYIEFEESGGTGSSDANKLRMTSDTTDRAKTISEWLSGGVSTGIIRNADVDKNRTVIYDMQGRKLQSINGRGLYIVNGKKEFRR